MARFKKLIAIILATLCVLAFANQGDPNMESNETLVISYEYPIERIVKESSTKLHQNSKYTFHCQGNFDVVILGEKQKIVIPGMQECFIVFYKNYQTTKLYFEPTNYWLTFPKLIEHIRQIKETLSPIKKISLKTYEFDLNKLTAKHFENEEAELISQYELEHYKIFFVAKKLMTPKEIHPREHDLFQLTLRVETKKI